MGNCCVSCSCPIRWTSAVQNDWLASSSPSAQDAKANLAQQQPAIRAHHQIHQHLHHQFHLEGSELHHLYSSRLDVGHSLKSGEDESELAHDQHSSHDKLLGDLRPHSFLRQSRDESDDGLDFDNISTELERELLALKVHVARSHALLLQYQSKSLGGSKSEMSTHSAPPPSTDVLATCGVKNPIVSSSAAGVRHSRDFGTVADEGRDSSSLHSLLHCPSCGHNALLPSHPSVASVAASAVAVTAAASAATISPTTATTTTFPISLGVATTTIATQTSPASSVLDLTQAEDDTTARTLTESESRSKEFLNTTIEEEVEPDDSKGNEGEEKKLRKKSEEEEDQYQVDEITIKLDNLDLASSLEALNITSHQLPSVKLTGTVSSSCLGSSTNNFMTTTDLDMAVSGDHTLYAPKPAFDHLEQYRMLRKLSVLPEETEDTLCLYNLSPKVRSPMSPFSTTSTASSPCYYTPSSSSSPCYFTSRGSERAKGALHFFSDLKGADGMGECALTSRAYSELFPELMPNNLHYAATYHLNPYGMELPLDMRGGMGSRGIEEEGMGTMNKAPLTNIPESPSMLSPQSITSQMLALRSPISPFSTPSPYSISPHELSPMSPTDKDFDNDPFEAMLNDDVILEEPEREEEEEKKVEEEKEREKQKELEKEREKEKTSDVGEDFSESSYKDTFEIRKPSLHSDSGSESSISDRLMRSVSSSPMSDTSVKRKMKEPNENRGSLTNQGKPLSRMRLRKHSMVSTEFPVIETLEEDEERYRDRRFSHDAGFDLREEDSGDESVPLLDLRSQFGCIRSASQQDLREVLERTLPGHPPDMMPPSSGRSYSQSRPLQLKSGIATVATTINRGEKISPSESMVDDIPEHAMQSLIRPSSAMACSLIAYSSTPVNETESDSLVHAVLTELAGHDKKRRVSLTLPHGRSEAHRTRSPTWSHSTPECSPLGSPAYRTPPEGTPWSTPRASWEYQSPMYLRKTSLERWASESTTGFESCNTSLSHLTPYHSHRPSLVLEPGEGEPSLLLVPGNANRESEGLLSSRDRGTVCRVILKPPSLERNENDDMPRINDDVGATISV